MPPRTQRGGGPGPQQPSPQQQQQLPPPQGYGNNSGGGPPSHLHMFHQHNNNANGGPGSGNTVTHMGGGGNNGGNPNSGGNVMYGGGGMQNSNSPMYGGGYNGGAPSNMMQPPSPHAQQQQQQPPPPPPQQMVGGMGNDYGPMTHASPYPQQQQQQGGGGISGAPGSANRRVRTPGPSTMPPPPPPPLQQSPQQYYQGGGGVYNTNMRGSAPPPPPRMEPSPSFASGGLNPPPMMRDGGYGTDMENSPPPPNSSYRGGSQQPQNSSNPNSMQSPPAQQQQQQSPQQHYQGAPNSNYNSANRGSGGGGMMMNQGGPMPPPQQQQQQQLGMMGGAGPNSGPRVMNAGRQQGHGMPPPPPLSMQQQQQGGNWGDPQQQMQQMPPPHVQGGGMSPKPQPQQQQQQLHPPSTMNYGGVGNNAGSMMGGRNRGGNRMGPGPMNSNSMGGLPPPLNQQQQQQPPPPPPQRTSPPSMMQGGGGVGVGGMHGSMQPPPPPPPPPPMLSVQGGGGGMMMMNQGGPMPPNAYDPNMGPMDPNMAMMMPPPGVNNGGMPPGMMPNMQGGMGMSNGMPYMDGDDCGDLSPQQPLYEFLMEKRLLRQAPLEEFFPTGYDARRDGPLTVAVDGNYMITNLRAQLQRSDPLWFLHSCLPDRLLALVHAHVERMRALHLEPLWVLNGIGINGDVEAFLPCPEELQARDEVWRKLNEGEEMPTPDEVTEAFETSSATGEDVLCVIQRYLRTEEHVVCITAPFLNWCQMVTLHKEGVAHLLMGPPEMLMVPYDGMQAIAEMNLESMEVAYYDRDTVLRELFPSYVTETSTAAAGDRFMDFGLLIATHPAITTAHASVQRSTQEIYEELSTPNPNFHTLRDFIDHYEPQPLQSQRPNIEKLKHSKGRTYIQYSPVFTSQQNGESPLLYFIRVLDPTLSNANMPNNLTGVFGYQVPLSLFRFQFTGLLSVSLMTAVTQLYIRDEFPVADTQEYHALLLPLMALRGQIISQVASRIKSEGCGQRLGKISWVRWFNSILMNVLPPERLIVLDEWELGKSTELEKVPEDELENIDLATVLSLKSSVSCVSAQQMQQHSSSPRDGAVLYRSRKETLVAILLKTFDFVGYFSHSVTKEEEEEGEEMGGNGDDPQYLENGENTPEEAEMDEEGGEHRIFFTAFLSVSLQHCPQAFQCALVRFTELLRVGTISATPFRCADSLLMDADMSEQDPAEVLLASRIACLVSIPYLDQRSLDGGFEWAPVYSRELCAFTVMARVMNRSLRVLTEAIAAAQFLTAFSDCSLEEYETLSTLLPFGDVPSSLGGLLLHYVLVFPADYEANCQTPQERCALLETKFKAIPNLQGQLRRVMEFTFQALYLLNVYRTKDSTIVSAPELCETEVVADALNLLREKWEQHLEGPPPEDVHHAFTFQ